MHQDRSHLMEKAKIKRIKIKIKGFAIILMFRRGYLGLEWADINLLIGLSNCSAIQNAMLKNS